MSISLHSLNRFLRKFGILLVVCKGKAHTIRFEIIRTSTFRKRIEALKAGAA